MSAAVVLGDAILDVWRDLRATRPSPEDATVPVVTERRPPVVTLGGALKVAQALSSALKVAKHVGFLDTHQRTSGDHERLRAALAAWGVRYHGRQAREAPVGLTRKVRTQVDGRTVFREDRDVLAYPQPYDGRELTEVLRAPFSHNVTRAVIAVDYGKGAITMRALADVIAAARPHLLVLDAKPRLLVGLLTRPAWMLDRFGLLRVPDTVVKLNWAEAQATCRHVFDDQPQGWADLGDLSNLVAAQLSADLVVTQGAQGALLNPGTSAEIAVDAGQGAGDAPRCVVGAGDVFTAHLVSQLMRERSLRQAVTTAVTEATRVVLDGTLAPSP